MVEKSPEAEPGGIMGVDTVKKASETTLLVPLRKVVGETTAETKSLLSASVENYSDSSVQIRSEFSTFQYHVLAVDDSRTDRRVIEKLLKTSSYKVTTVNSAVEALQVLGLAENCSSTIEKVDVNLIMTDYCMPEMTGYDLLKKVKAATSALKEIPVVIMSSENDSTRIERCLAEGAEEFIIKPVKMADVKRLREHIRPVSSASSTTGDSSGSTSGKRKASEAREALEVTSSERRPRLSVQEVGCF